VKDVKATATTEEKTWQRRAAASEMEQPPKPYQKVVLSFRSTSPIRLN